MKLKITVEQKYFQRDWLEDEKKQILDNSKRFSIKSGQLCYKESRLVIANKDCQVDIIYDFHEGSGNTSQLILGESQHTKKLLPVSFGMGFTTMLRTTYKNVIVIKDKVVCHIR